MEKETITIEIAAHIYGTTENQLHDKRTLRIDGTRGQVAKLLDEFCESIESEFDH